MKISGAGIQAPVFFQALQLIQCLAKAGSHCCWMSLSASPLCFSLLPFILQKALPTTASDVYLNRKKQTKKSVFSCHHPYINGFGLLDLAFTLFILITVAGALGLNTPLKPGNWITHQKYLEWTQSNSLKDLRKLNRKNPDTSSK